MTSEKWNEICSEIADRMKEHVRPFVCPLSKETDKTVRLIGTGSFVCLDDRAAIITCDHVAAHEPLNFRFSTSEDVFGYRDKWHRAKEPIDAAWTDIPLNPIPDTNAIITSDAVATAHSVCQDEEPLFFYGFAGENSAFAFDQHVTNGTGYLTQQNRDSAADSSVLELLWPPTMPRWSNGTSSEAQKNMKFSDPRGFSGSLVWNTRFLETGGDLTTWSPQDARVTGLLKRFEEESLLLLATPIERLRPVIPFPS